MSPRVNLNSLGPNPSEKIEDADTVPPRQQEMPELVHEHEDAEHEDEGQDVGHVVVLALEAAQLALAACSLDSVYVRAQASSSLMAASVSGRCTPWRAAASRAASMLPAMAGNGTAPSRKDATATSLAAFSTTG